jgi:hypothetical protein
MSFNKNLVVSGFTLALLVASSYGGDFPGANNPSYGEFPGEHSVIQLKVFPMCCETQRS